MPLQLNHARLNKPTLIELNQEGQLPKEVMVLPVGNYDTYVGKLSITNDMLEEMVANFKNGVPNAVPINFDHMYGEAAGWVTELVAKADDALYAVVEWTRKGEEALTDKIYRFLSAEFSTNYEDSTFGKEHGNVLSGIGLTNYPMLQNIPALLNQQGKSDKDKSNITILYSQEGEFMNLEEIRVKAPAELTEDEKTFLGEHQAELTDEERTNFGLESGDSAQADADAAEDSGAAGEDTEAEADEAEAEGESTELSQGQKVQLSQAQFQALQKAANDGSRAMAELNRARVEREADTFVFSQTNQDGAFLPKSKNKVTNFLFSLDAKQRQAFKELMAEAPKGITQLTQEVGDGGAATGAGNRLNQLAQAKVDAADKAGKTITFSQALEEVERENPDLVNAEYGKGDE